MKFDSETEDEDDAAAPQETAPAPQPTSPVTEPPVQQQPVEQPPVQPPQIQVQPIPVTTNYDLPSSFLPQTPLIEQPTYPTGRVPRTAAQMRAETPLAPVMTPLEPIGPTLKELEQQKALMVSVFIQ